MGADFDKRVWDGMIAHLRAQHAMICRNWFGELEPRGVAGGAIHVRASSDLHRDYLRRMCSEAFNDAARTVSGHLLTVRFLGPNEDLTLTTPKGTRKGRDAVPAAPTPRLVEVKEPARFESLVVNPDFGFESFVVGPANRLAHAAARAVAANPGQAYNPFFIHGGVGLGKTHLLQAVCLELARARPSTRLYYISCEGFLTQFMECVQSGQMGDFRHRYRDVDVLVIDDIHFLAKRDRTQEEFFHTFNSLYQANKQIILSSDAAPEEIPDLEERLVSRFKWGLVVKIEPPGFETRVEILKAKATLRGLVFPDDVALFLAQRIDTNIRELEGAVVKLQIQSSVEQRPIDLPLARSALGEALPPPQGSPTIQTILGAVTEYYGVRVPDLQGKRRQRSVALPRQVCMYLARRHTRMSLEEIGGYFGGRDHTTVMHAIKSVEGKREPDSDFDVLLRTIEQRLAVPLRMT